MMPHSVVVGGTRGIGRAVVRAFAQEGHAVSVIGRRPPSDADQQLARTHYWAVDLLDEAGLSTAVQEMLQRHGPVRHLVFCQRYRGAGNEWDGELATSLTATRALIERLRDAFDVAYPPAIVIINSVANRLVAEEASPGYQVAKAGLLQLMRYYAVALGSRGIRVNCVSPCTVIKDESRAFYGEHPEITELYQRVIPLARMGTADDVAQAVVWLCSPGASFVTGHDLVVDGGLSVRLQDSLARQLVSAA